MVSKKKRTLKNIYIYIYINKTRLSPITQFFKHNFLFLYRFHCYTDHQEFIYIYIFFFFFFFNFSGIGGKGGYFRLGMGPKFSP